MPGRVGRAGYEQCNSPRPYLKATASGGFGAKLGLLSQPFRDGTGGFSKTGQKGAGAATYRVATAEVRLAFS